MAGGLLSLTHMVAFLCVNLKLTVADSLGESMKMGLAEFGRSIRDAPSTLSLIHALHPRGATQVENTESVNDLGVCREAFPLTPLDDIGFGWDNLQNTVTSKVFKMTYKKCETTPDGKYFVPDNVIALEVKETRMDRTANFYRDYRDFVSTTSDSINIEGSATIPKVWISVGGSFSTSQKEVKFRSASSQSSVFYTGIQHHAYTLLLQEPFEFEDNLKARLLDLGKAVKGKDLASAQYHSQAITHSYGTHVLTSAKMGAEVGFEDYINTNMVLDDKTTMKDIQASSALGFFNIVKLNATWGKGRNNSEIKNISSIRRVSKVRMKGAFSVIEAIPNGKQLDANVANYWKSQSKYTSGKAINLEVGLPPEALLSPAPEQVVFHGVPGNEEEKPASNVIAAIDRSGVPLYQVINQYALPELPFPVVAEIAYWVKNATIEYYLKNTHYGCMDPLAVGFNFSANAHDQSRCKIDQTHRYKLGGFFQKTDPMGTTEPGFEAVINGMSGDFNCLPPYEQTRLVEYRTGPVAKGIVAKLYWCQGTSDILARTGYMFGGMFAGSGTNYVTRSASCPGQFRPLKLLFDITVCLSRNYEVDQRFAADFGGFLSNCEEGMKECPEGYSAYLVHTYSRDYTEQDAGCKLQYCARLPPELSTELKLNSPPYVPLPKTKREGAMVETYV